METNPLRHRDDGLRRVSAITRWVAGASAGAAALFAVIAAHPKLPASPIGRVSRDSTTATSSEGTASDPSTVGPSAADPGSLGSGSVDTGNGVSPPAAPPVRTRRNPQVVSGSS